MLVTNFTIFSLIFCSYIQTIYFILQAPTSMKSVLQAVNLLTVAFGNVIVIIVAEAKAFDQVGLNTRITGFYLDFR